MAGRRTAVGVIVSRGMNKTVVVSVERLVRDRRYGKTLRLATRLKAHDARQACQVGAQVEVAETRPRSRETHWRVARILHQPPEGVQGSPAPGSGPMEST